MDLGEEAEENGKKERRWERGKKKEVERASKDKFLATSMLACKIDMITQACQVTPY